MKSEFFKNTFGLAAIIVGVCLFFGGVRIGTDPQLEFGERAMAAGAMTPAGVLFLATSYRVMRKEKNGSVSAGKSASREESAVEVKPDRSGESDHTDDA